MKNGEKVERLLSKWGPEQSMERIRNVMYADKDLDNMSEASIKVIEPILYDDLEVSENVKEVLKMS